jgi:hypothetical protein
MRAWQIALVALALLVGAGALAFASGAAHPAPPPAPPSLLTPVAGVVYDDQGGAVSLWDAASGATRVLVPATAQPQALAAGPAGDVVAYLAPGPAGGALDLRVWRQGAPSRTVPISGTVGATAQAQFLDATNLLILDNPGAYRPGPLYLYDTDAGRLRTLAHAVDSFAAGSGLLAFAAPLGDAVSAPHAILLLDIAGGGAPITVAQREVAPRTARPAQIYYDAARRVFRYTLAQASTVAGSVTVQLGGFPATPAPTPYPEVTLTTNGSQPAVRWSATGGYLLVSDSVARGGAPAPGAIRFGASWRLVALDLSGPAPALAPAPPADPATTLSISDSALTPGRDLLSIRAQQLITRTAAGVTYTTPGAPAVAVYDPATGRLSTLVANAQGEVLAALDAGRLLVRATATGPSAAPRLLLAAPGDAGWQVTPLGDPFPAGAVLRFVGLLPGGAALVASDAPAAEPGAAALYRVPLDGGPRTALAARARGGAVLPLAGPPP